MLKPDWKQFTEQQSTACNHLVGAIKTFMRRWRNIRSNGASGRTRERTRSTARRISSHRRSKQRACLRSAGPSAAGEPSADDPSIPASRDAGTPTSAATTAAPPAAANEEEPRRPQSRQPTINRLSCPRYSTPSQHLPQTQHRRGRHRHFAIGHGRTPRRHGIALISLPRLALRPMKKGRLVSQAPRTSPNGNCSSILPIRSRRIGTRIRARWLPGVNHNLLLHVPVVAMQLHS